MAAQAKTMLNKSKPWRKDMPWPVLAVEGVIALVIGIVTLADKNSATKNLLFLVGAFLLLNGVVNGIAGLRDKDGVNPLTPFRLLQAGAGFVAGLIVVIDRFSDMLSDNGARVVLGIGLVVTSGLLLYGMAMARKELNPRPSAYVPSLLLFAWGCLFFYAASTDTSSAVLIGWVAVVIGVALLGLAALKYRAAHPGGVEATDAV